MEVKGRIFKVMDPLTGQSSRGQWKKQEFIIETTEQYPRKVCFAVWNDKISIASLTPNQVINIHFNAESREYNGRWYTELSAWKMDTEGATAINDMPPPPQEIMQAEEDSLPF